MINKARETIKDLGLESALERRFASLEDISVNNVLFADRSARKRMTDVFDEVAAKTPDKVKNLDKVEEINIDIFLSEIIPKSERIEMLVETKHSPNFVSLIAPVDSTAKQIFKWGNLFSWSYAGEMADSIKERVKRAGGTVTGDLRCSLIWFNTDDLDLHMKEANGFHIYYADKKSFRTGGTLDVDANAAYITRTPVENIIYPDRKKMGNGVYDLFVNQYRRRESTDVGFEVEIEFDGQIYHMASAESLPSDKSIPVAKIRLKEGVFTILESLPHSQTSKTMWGVQTQTFVKVQTIMLSPNYWDDPPVGNKHYLFFLEGCQNDGKARGFFNEFLTQEINQHRKVLEIVGSKIRVDGAENQLSGVGFSSTKHDSVVVRVRGSFSRDLRITF